MMKSGLFVLTVTCLLQLQGAATVEKYQENVIPAVNQVRRAVETFGADPARATRRVAFVGNSITRHSPKPSVGWTNDCGMAASSIDKDYVHVCAAELERDVPGGAYRLMNVAGALERTFMKPEWTPEQYFKGLKDFKPDIVVFFFGANVPKTYDADPSTAARSFGAAVESLARYLDTGHTRFLISEGFYVRPVLDAEKKAAAERLGATFVAMDDIRQRDDAHGRFNHPGDTGMRLIAERFASAIRRLSAVPSFTMRIDDNHPVADWERVAEIFGSRGIRVSFAVVPSGLSEEQGACLRRLAEKGHVIMDHTPNHTFYQATYHDRAAFDRAKAQPFVAEADEKAMKLYFRCEADEAHPKNHRARATITGNVITFATPKSVRGMYDFIRIPGDEAVYGLQKDKKNGTFELRDFWRRPLARKIDLADVEVVVFDQAALQPCDDILRELASVTRERFDHFGLPRPTVWVRPGGWDAGVSWDRLERVYGREFGYAGADSGVNIAKGTNRWSTGYDAMYFFDQGANITPEQLVDQIQARLAKGLYHVTLSHMWSRVLPGGQEEWFAKTERFAQLLVDRKVPTLTMPETLTARFGEPTQGDDLQSRIDAASAAGGGRVVVPAGRHLVGQIDLKSNVELHLEKGAVLEGKVGLENYRVTELPYSEGTWSAVVSAIGVTNVAVTGEGEIFGNGTAWPQPEDYGGNQEGRRPRGLFFADTKGIRLADFKLRDAACWGVVLKCCEDVDIRRLTIDNHANANNDGIDVEAKNVVIADCDIDAGDDGVCLKSNTPDFVVENVLVTNVTARSHCNGLKLGTASHGTMRNILFVDCRTESPRRDFIDRRFGRNRRWYEEDPNRVKHYPGGLMGEAAGSSSIVVENVDGGTVENVVYRNITVHGSRAPIFVRAGTRTGRSCGTPPSDKYVFRNVTIENVTGEAMSVVASSVTGVPGCRIANVTLRNVNIVTRGGGENEAERTRPVPEVAGKYPDAHMFGMPLPAYGLYARHVDGLRLENVSFTLVPGAVDRREMVVLDDVVQAKAAVRSPLKVLMIGNSFSASVMRETPTLAAMSGLPLDIVQCGIGGCPLERHWENVEKASDPTFKPYSVSSSYASDPSKKLPHRMNVTEALVADKWDVVTIQQASGKSPDPTSYQPYADNLIAKIRELAPQAEIVIQETWSYSPYDGRLKSWKKTPAEMHAELRKAYLALAEKHGLRWIPTGDAVQLFRERLPVAYGELLTSKDIAALEQPNTIDFHGDVCGESHWGKGRAKYHKNWQEIRLRTDFSHFNARGHYLQACVWLAKLFAVDPTTFAYKPANLSEADAKLMRECARDAVAASQRH